MVLGIQYDVNVLSDTPNINLHSKINDVKTSNKNLEQQTPFSLLKGCYKITHILLFLPSPSPDILKQIDGPFGHKKQSSLVKRYLKPKSKMVD